MSDFVNRTVKVMDALTLAVLFEQGDLDYTMCEYWDCVFAYRPDRSTNLPPVSGVRKPPEQRVSCLACLCKRAGQLADAESNRASLLKRVRLGDFQITKVWLRTELSQCSRCGVLPPKPINPDWLDTLL